MINYRVDNLELFNRRIEKKTGVTFIDEMVSDEYGKFCAHYGTLKENKIELWEDLG